LGKIQLEPAAGLLARSLTVRQHHRRDDDQEGHEEVIQVGPQEARRGPEVREAKRLNDSRWQLIDGLRHARRALERWPDGDRRGDQSREAETPPERRLPHSAQRAADQFEDARVHAGPPS
jgi:hypothetical protein